MRRRPSAWVAYVAGCDQPPANAADIRQEVAYAIGKLDGAAEERKELDRQVKAALEVAELEDEFGDGEGGLR